MWTRDGGELGAPAGSAPRSLIRLAPPPPPALRGCPVPSRDGVSLGGPSAGGDGSGRGFPYPPPATVAL
jgi:hypothetical protein